MREPIVLDSDDLDHVEELLEALSEGYHIISEDPEKQEQYEAMLERLQEARP